MVVVRRRRGALVPVDDRMMRYTLMRWDPSGDWFLDLGAGRLFLLVELGGAWHAFQPGRLVARGPSRGRVVSMVIHDLLTKESV